MTKFGQKKIAVIEHEKVSKVKQKVEQIEKGNVGKTIANKKKVWAKKKNGLFGWVSSSMKTSKVKPYLLSTENN